MSFGLRTQGSLIAQSHVNGHMARGCSNSRFSNNDIPYSRHLEMHTKHRAERADAYIDVQCYVNLLEGENCLWSVWPSHTCLDNISALTRVVCPKT